MTTVTLNIPDGVQGHDVLVEAACRLFDAQKLTKTEASRMCGMTRVEFDAALMERGLPVIRYTEEMWGQDQEALDRMRAGEATREKQS